MPQLPTTSSRGGLSTAEKLEHSPYWGEQQNPTAATASASGASGAAFSRRMYGVKEKRVGQDNASPLFLTFETVSQEATEALLLAASDLAVVVEADGRYEDVFAAPLTPKQLQQQQMLEEHLRELVREALQVDALLQTFAVAFENGPGKRIIAAVPTPQLSARSPTDRSRRPAGTGAASTAEAREHLGGDSSKSSSQTATRCTSAAAKQPASAAASAGLYGSHGTTTSRGAAGINAEGGRLVAAGPLPTRSAAAAAETTPEACQSHDGKGISTSGARRQQCGFPPGSTSPSGVCSTSAAGTSTGQHAAASGTGAAAAGSGAPNSPGLEALSVSEGGSFHGEQKCTRSEQHRPPGEAPAPAKRKGDAQEVEENDEEEEGGNFRQQALQQDSLCDFFVNIVRFCYREQCSAAETSTLLGIMKKVLQHAVLENQTALASFRHFKHLLLKYSVQRPPLSIEVFTPRTLQSANRFVVNSFYRHFQLYVQCFIPEVHVVTVQQPVPVTNLGRLKLPSCTGAAAASPGLAALVASRQQSLWSLAAGAGGDTTPACGLISSNESSQLDAFLPVLPEESNDPGAKSRRFFAKSGDRQEEE